ncbi:16S rRNA (guanine(966)-N(2))-methyltransferase RsmD [Alkalihalobacillus oceani]|uniref:16S rRNA (Guanine(966)-N(2))-methyltransferase RsmD n=1 Tax=Halalkalibacter oceani TaxID=1653776 RepID=A0A9X2DLR0_9BACI|nr:16S rRNA (guanine(966)-N(2))-methyltransferase RsmD [Halalkalibacter oceani]MCM3713081.1 16S rRNA (guanine(966)-N(2))-methyltransferase RsmD [Halalkalibacter oceani]
MRVISGNKKGLPLKAVPGSSTRPTTDKVKESIFNMIGPYFTEGRALDLYAGSGGLGIEALSRGVEQAIFVDQNRKAVEVVKQNLADCELTDRAEVYRNEASRALKALLKRKLTFSHVFLDPPYAKQNLVNEIRILQDFGLLGPACTIICEHDRAVELPDCIGDVNKQRSETYGDTTITIYNYTVEGGRMDD